MGGGATGTKRRSPRGRNQNGLTHKNPDTPIAEGFGRYNPAEFVQFLDIAIASLDETDNHLRDGAEDKIFEPVPAAEAIRLCAQCRSMSVRLRAYLMREAARHPRKARRRQRGK